MPMNAPQCHICGETMTLQSTPDNSGYKSAVAAGIDDIRFKGELYWFQCPRCGKKTHPIRRDDYPDAMGLVKTKEEAIWETKWLFLNFAEYE